MMGRRVNEDMEDLTPKTTEVFLEGLKGLSQDTFHHAVRYKQSVLARKQSRLQCCQLEIEETDNLATLLRSLYADTKLETIMAEHKRNFFMNLLIDHQATRPGTSAGIQYSKGALLKDKIALDWSSVELRLLQQCDQSNRGKKRYFYKCFLSHLPIQEFSVVDQLTEGNKIFQVLARHRVTPALPIIMDPSGYWQFSNSDDELTGNSYPQYDVHATNFGSGSSSSNSQGLNYPQTHQSLPPPIAQPDQGGYNSHFDYTYSPQFPPGHPRHMTILPTHPEDDNSLYNLFKDAYDATPPQTILLEEAPLPTNQDSKNEEDSSGQWSYVQFSAVRRKMSMKSTGRIQKPRKGKQRLVQNPHKLPAFNPAAVAVHQTILNTVSLDMQKHAVSTTSFLDQKLREVLVKEKLKACALASFNLNPQDESDIGRKWPSWAQDTLRKVYKEVASPMSLVMQKCRSLAKNLCIRGYRLQPEARSSEAADEKDYGQRKVRELIRKPQQEMDEDDTHTNISLLFIFDEHSSPFEHNVIWDIVLDTVCQLNLTQHTCPDSEESLDGLFATATAAAYCILEGVLEGRSREFSVTNFQFIYNKLMNYITQEIYPNAERCARWLEYKKITQDKLIRNKLQ
ncbi:hypothetical protein DFH29DRAFT_874398 [Suillus ampliporus]|nr:hypothetical protein DFH29DRAFT_874398 [Suillus ampliporus]